MQFPADVFIKIIISALSMGGFFVAYHIYQHKRDDEPLVCPVGFDCNAVVTSDYSHFMKIPLEIVGMVYYILLSFFYIVSIFIHGNIMPMMLSSFLLLASLGACLFSIYLISIQIFVLKKGCSWCFVSAFISIFIFILTALNYDFSSIAQIFSK